MNWETWMIMAGAIGMVVVWKRLTLVAPELARKQLQEGALVVDVRSVGEFRDGHLPGAVNVPLDELPSGLSRHVAGKEHVVLLHCLSGTRSGMAARQLKRAGYRNVFNLGSLQRAKQITSNRNHS